VGQFSRFVAASGYRTEAERGASGGSGWNGNALAQSPSYNWKNPGFSQTDAHPVTLVTYDDAAAFASWASGVAGRRVSLPTEAQWEWAYRGATITAWYSGSRDSDGLSIGWFKQNAGNGTRPVAQKKANLFGLFDMAGNVYEWCQDWYAPYPTLPVTDPLASTPDAKDKPRRVLRGGSWLKDARHGRGAARYRNTPGSRNADNGFRVVASRDASRATPPPAPPPSPPSTPAEPEPASPSHSAGGCDAGTVFGLTLCPTGIVVLVVVGAVMLSRRLSAPAQPEVSFRVGPDGFWILAQKRLAGATLHYRHRSSTGAHEGNVVLEPSEAGQFVYTGHAPLAVEVVQLLVPERQQGYRQPPPQQQRSGWRNSGPAVREVHHHHHHHESSRSSTNVVVVEHHHHDDSSSSSSGVSTFQGYPPAY
jgi:hypothetical protein